MDSIVVRIFKALSSIALVAVLFLLTTNREIILSPKKITPHKKTTQTEFNQPAPILLQQDATTSEAAVIAPLTENQPAPIVEISPIKQEPVAEAVETTKKSLYIPMEEGQSDTDNSYQPSISPCKVTMGYKIGRFDTQFGISKIKFIEEIDAASSLWGEQVEKNLFKYDEKGPLTLNLIYDERQAQTEDIKNLAIEIENTKNTAEALKKTFEQEKIIYVGDGEQLMKESEDLKTKYEIYSDKVKMYNSQGGAPYPEYERMNQELETLKQTSKNLTIRRDALIVYMGEINAKVTRYNELVSYINTLIKRSNTLGAKRFTEGRFSPSTNTIDIYQYNDTVKLRRVIAHELGHVLGINHTETLSSIMYAVNTGTSTSLSTEDVRALHEVCPQ